MMCLAPGKMACPCIGVLFGYGSRQELEAAGVDRIATTVQDLRYILEE